jgi:hypothetical protein
VRVQVLHSTARGTAAQHRARACVCV